MTKNQSLCFLKSKTNRTYYWVFPSNAKRRPIAVEIDSYLFRSHTLLKLSQLLACQTNKKSSLNLTGQLWKTMLGNSLQRLQTIRWPSFGEEYPINWTLRLILAPCNQLQRQKKTFIFHSNTISAELNDFSSRELLFFSRNKKDHRIFSVSQVFVIRLCKK